MHLISTQDQSEEIQQRHSISQIVKIKDKDIILKAAREKCKEAFLKIINKFQRRNFKGQKEWNDIFKLLKEKEIQPRILYSGKFSLKKKIKVKTFPDK